VPMNIHEVCRFMGLVKFYRRFMEGFSKILNSIMELQNKDKKFVSTKKCEHEFNNHKKLLTIAPILKVPNMDPDFMVCIDASKE
jgi:hypothetical protein